MSTPFQTSVYALVSTVPKGKVTTYGAIAKALGKRGHTARAIGQALNRNPAAPDKVPCHRVVCADGNIGGYGFGGAAPKIMLLEQEGVKVLNGKVMRFESVFFSL